MFQKQIIVRQVLAPFSEKERLSVLERYQILDTPFEKQFDDLVTLASQICATPIALISLVDSERQWFKARVGIDALETPRSISACQYAIEQSGVMTVPDTLLDARFKTNPLVTGDPHMRFYAGAPLQTPSGHRIGTLCVLDTKPRELTAEQITALTILSQQVVTMLELRLALFEREAQDKVLAAVKKTADDRLERINLALDSGAILGTWVWNMAEDNVTGDERFARTFGFEFEEVDAGVPIARAFESVHPADMPGLQTQIESALANKERFRAEYRVRTHHDKSSWTWVEAVGRVEFNDTGAPIRFPGVLIDIEERKRIERAYQETTQRYQLLFDSIDEGFCILDMIFDEKGTPVDYRFVQINPAFEAQTSLVNAKGRSTRELGKPHEQFWYDTYAKVAKTGEPIRFINNVSALHRWFDVYAFRVDANSERVAVLFRDITAQREAVVALRKSEENLNLMVESAQDYAIISLSETGVINSWNKGAERIFGYKPCNAIGKTIELIFTQEDIEAGASRYELAAAAKNGRASDERWHQRENGERFYASGIMAAMYNDEHKVTGFVKIARDMTAQQAQQEALLEARNAAEAANIAKTEFLANMSHEIRTPMNAIIGLANILSFSQPLTDRQREFIRTLQMSADSLLSLINDLLDIAKIEARTVELEQIPFSITQMVQEIISMMTVRVRDKGLTFKAHGESVRHRMFIGDPTRLRQVVLNLCSNAIKFTDSGTVDVSITCHPSTIPGMEEVCIAVTDTGIGIQPDKLETIFEKFIQADTSINRKYGGTGLGLAITKTIAEIMGGNIQVESIYGQGSTFTVRIPLRIATDTDVQPSEATLSYIAETSIERKIKPRVLLVEDYEPNVLVASTILEEYGYLVDVASNGTDAVSMVEHGQYIAVLMDVQMHGMNGLEATQTIRSHEARTNSPRIPIIGMTAHALAGDRERCLGVGMDDYISKPFNPEELRRKLESMMAVEGE